MSNSLCSISRSRWGNSSVKTPWGFSRIFRPSTKSFRSGTCASTLLPRTRSALTAFGCQLFRQLSPEELHQRGNAFFDRHLGDVCRGLNAQNRHVSLDKILKQVAVVAGYLDHEALLSQAESLRHFVAVTLAMFEPRVGIGGEIRVVAKNILGSSRIPRVAPGSTSRRRTRAADSKSRRG